MSAPRVQLKIRVHGRHPWFYRKMVRRPDATIPAGSAVSVVDRDEKFVGTGFYNPRTELALRLFAREYVEDPASWLAARLTAAIRFRHQGLGLGGKELTGYRLAHSEADGLPGLVVDRLGDAIVAQVFSLCVMQRIEGLGETLRAAFPAATLVLLGDERSRELEGFERPPRSRPFETDVVEHGITYRVRPGQDHKTGFFADQRESRALVGRLARGRRVLDLCCNSGGFALNAARGGAREVVAYDLDEVMVEQAKANATRNRLTLDARHGDAFDVLRETRDDAYDLIVLDPPKWILGKDPDDVGAMRYRDLNQLAFQKVAPGGFVVTSSCSGALSESRFLGILADAAARADRDASAIHVGGAGADHPVALECPQTRYLKVCAFRVGPRDA